MKTKLLYLPFEFFKITFIKKNFAVFLLLNIFVMNAQIFTFTGNGDGTSWNDPQNWDQGSAVPYLSDNDCNVSIGSAFTVTIPTSVTLLMNSGNITGPGKIINNGTFTINTNSSKYFINLTFSNVGTFNLGTGTNFNTMYLANAVVTNETEGTLVSNGLAISSDGNANNMLHNKGLLKKLGNFEKSFATPFTNIGTIAAEVGILTFNTTRYLETGTYNVSEGATLQTTGNGGNLKGTWSGTNNGTFLLNGNNNVSIATDVVTNEITGNGISFTTGNLSGPGAFINKTVFTFDSNNSKYFINLNFSNIGNLNLGTGTSFNTMYLANAVITNETVGTVVSNGIAISSDGTASNMLNNKGLFKKLGNYEKSFSTPFTNNGTISAEVGTLTFTSIFNNQTSGIVKGYSVKLPAAANLTNNGTFAPGMSPGTLTVQNFFKMDNGILEIDINGATANTQYDVLNYTGTTAPVLNGMIKVNLTYLPTVNTEYTVFNSPNVALSGTLPTSVTAYYDGYNYTFDVIKNTNNIVLKYVSATLTTSETEKEFTKIYPNPTSDFIYFKGKENVTSATIFGLEGRLLSEQKLNSNEGKVDLTNLKTGNYILILKYENSTKNYKVIKK